ncbi:OprO/OprP family phosphate-selective porin [Halomonas sp. ANAO-440]|uniref:OprO/OprP family phosphate-selective porin n=1 Tax=Halomonas sp. ANAO-440 TaxID=2861360 RepID=UPI001CAA5FAA|nr:OprO/OprP family phosphate-selective porin [Halomonas sp. ANAO-440]MBZ0331156.1 OprO/OprP family phosphate-selective porin [Halomonas sp. ANAO-440]
MIESKLFRWSSRCSPLLAALALGAPVAAAEEGVLDTLQMHGFLSQALVITDRNDFFGPSSSDSGSLKYTEIGANVSLRPHQDFLVAAQLLSRRAGGDGQDARPVLDYGVIDYQLHSSQQRTLGVQAGRFKNPFGFYNQTRDVAFTRPSILLPQSIYFDRTRSLGLSADGGSVYAEERLDTGTLRVKAGIGTPTTRGLEDQLFPPGMGVHVDGSTSYIGQVLYEHGNGQFTAALSAADVNLDLSSGFGDGELNFQPWILSLQYDQENWALTGEYAIRNVSLSGDIRQSDTTGESWYVQYTRRFHPDWKWLIRYDSLVTDRSDRSGTAYQAQGLGPAHARYADDITMGLQWNATPRLLLAAEYHHIDGTGWLPLQDNPDPAETKRRWNMLLFQLSLRF